MINYIRYVIPPSMWEKYMNSTIRTTNSCEVFYLKCNSMFYTGHPNIYKLVIFFIRNIEIEVYTEIGNMI